MKNRFSLCVIALLLLSACAKKESAKVSFGGKKCPVVLSVTPNTSYGTGVDRYVVRLSDGSSFLDHNEGSHEEHDEVNPSTVPEDAWLYRPSKK